RMLFGHVSDILKAGQAVDLVTFAQKRVDDGTIEAMGGPAGITDVYGYAPNDRHFFGHLEELRDKLARRKALALAREIERLSHDADSAREIVEAPSAPITEIHDIVAESRPARDTRAILSACLGRFEARVAGREHPMGIETSL